MNYNRKVPALLQSKMSLSDELSMTLKREFVEGYVLKKKWAQFGETSPLLVSAQEVENGDGEFIKVKVIPYDDTTA
jgi:hypothetical protein